MYYSRGLESMSELSDEKIDKLFRDSIREYLREYARVLEKTNETLAKQALAGKLHSDPNFALNVLSYLAFRSQELLTKKNISLQRWLVVFSAIAVIVPIVVEIIAKFG